MSGVLIIFRSYSLAINRFFSNLPKILHRSVDGNGKSDYFSVTDFCHPRQEMSGYLACWDKHRSGTGTANSIPLFRYTLSCRIYIVAKEILCQTRIERVSLRETEWAITYMLAPKFDRYSCLPAWRPAELRPHFSKAY
jgi:hypothetical protein